MAKNSPQDLAEIVARLAEFLNRLPDGETIQWVRFETDMRIACGSRDAGRGWMRRALKKIRRPWEIIYDTGIRLSSHASTFDISRHRTERIGNAIRNSADTHSQLADRHMNQMTSTGSQKFTMVGAFLNAVRMSVAPNEPKLIAVASEDDEADGDGEDEK